MIHLMQDDRVTSFPVGLEVLPSKLWWSADGSQVLFTSPARAQRDRSRRAISALDVRDGTIRELYESSGPLSNMHISPDGRRVVSLRSGLDAEDARLVISHVDDDLETEVLATVNQNGRFLTVFGQPLFSPDGARVLYVRRRDHATSLWIAGSDGAEERVLAEATRIVAPQWDPSGTMIAFQTWEETDRKAHLRIVSLDDGTLHEIEGFSDLSDPWLLDWSPDGAMLAVRETIGRSELWRVGDLLEDRAK